jgi:hypothetical protein
LIIAKINALLGRLMQPKKPITEPFIDEDNEPQEPCPACKGTGEYWNGHREPCQTCNGEGYVYEGYSSLPPWTPAALEWEDLEAAGWAVSNDEWLYSGLWLVEVLVEGGVYPSVWVRALTEEIAQEQAVALANKLRKVKKEDQV